MSSEIEVIPVSDQSRLEKIEQAINAELQSFVGRPIDDATLVEIEQTLANLIISQFMDDFLLQKAVEMGSDIAVLCDTDRGRVVRGVDIISERGIEDQSTIDVDLVLVDEESLT